MASVSWSRPPATSCWRANGSTTSGSPLKPPSLGVDFSNDYVAELQKQGKTDKEMMELVQARDSELPSEVTLKYNLFCLDLETGRIVWTRTFHDGPPPVGRHRKNSYTSETPVTACLVKSNANSTPAAAICCPPAPKNRGSRLACKGW